jgi:hypothetical protein
MTSILDQLTKALADVSNANVKSIFVNPANGKSPAPPQIAQWRADPSTMPLWAVNKLVPYAVAAQDSVSALPDGIGGVPGIQGVKDAGFSEIDPSWSNLPHWDGCKLWIAVPTAYRCGPKLQFAINALMGKHTEVKDGKVLNKIGFMPSVGNPVGRARNELLTHFMSLPGKPDWMLMIDDDMVIPFGNPQVWQSWGGPKELGMTDLVSRLVSQGKPLVGAMYVGRGAANHCQFSTAYENPSINRKYHSGVKNELVPCDWVATGALLINRSVLLAIAAKFPDLCPRFDGDTYRFFSMEHDEGEDMAFCKRARAAGIQPYVDAGCHCGHEGNFIFWPHNTTAVDPKPRPGQYLDAKGKIGRDAEVARATNPEPPKKNMDMQPRHTEMQAAPRGPNQVRERSLADIAASVGANTSNPMQLPPMEIQTKNSIPTPPLQPDSEIPYIKNLPPGSIPAINLI